jgi:hypothetical protein
MNHFSVFLDNILRYNKEYENVKWLQLDNPRLITSIAGATKMLLEFWTHEVDEDRNEPDQAQRISITIRLMIHIWMGVILKWDSVSGRIEQGWTGVKAVIDNSADPGALAERLYSQLTARHWLQAITVGLESQLALHIPCSSWDLVIPIKRKLESCDRLFEAQLHIAERIPIETRLLIHRSNVLRQGELIVMFMQYAMDTMPSASRLLSDDLTPFALDMIEFAQALASQVRMSELLKKAQAKPL